MSRRQRKTIIITCAITGAIHTPAMSDALPYLPEGIADQAIPPPRPVRPFSTCTRAIRRTAPSRSIPRTMPTIRTV